MLEMNWSTKCARCDGCGQVADTESAEPWSSWLALPVGSAFAVVAGIVKPRPCDGCDGSGKVPMPPVETFPRIQIGLYEDDDGTQIGISMQDLRQAVTVWSLFQQRTDQVTVGDAAIAFNVLPNVIVEAVGDQNPFFSVQATAAPVNEWLLIHDGY